jgi:hypothetical protein
MGIGQGPLDLEGQDIINVGNLNGSPPGSGGASLLHQATVTLTNAQIKALGADPYFEVVPAPGANKFHWDVSGFVYSTIVQPYTNLIEAQEVTVYWGETSREATLPVSAQAEWGALGASLMFQLRTIWDVTATPPQGYPITDPATIVNQALNFYLDNAPDGAFTGGDAGNSLVIGLTYKTFNTLTGLFE